MIQIQDFIDAVLHDRRNVPDDLCEQAIAAWDEAIDTLDSTSSLLIANAHACSEFDLPQGSPWIEVLAAAMDATEQINGTDHLRLLQLAMEEAGLTEAEA